MVEQYQAGLQKDLPERVDFIKRGYGYQEAELAQARASLTQKANSGDLYARGELTHIKERQKALQAQRENAVKRLEREPELIEAGELTFLVHALVVPSKDPEEIRHRDDAIEAIAMQVAVAHEQAAGAVVKDVHTPELARGAGLGDYPGFDLLSRRPDGSERAIEVKGRAQAGNVMISENEWSSACNLRMKYWIYVVFNCMFPVPKLYEIRDPWGSLVARTKSYQIEEELIMRSAENRI
jgi:hypothetical protein